MAFFTNFSSFFFVFLWSSVIFMSEYLVWAVSGLRCEQVHVHPCALPECEMLWSVAAPQAARAELHHPAPVLHSHPPRLPQLVSQP